MTVKRGKSWQWSTCCNNEITSDRKTSLKKDYGLDEAFDIFEKICTKRNKLNEYTPRFDNNINQKLKIKNYRK